VKIFHFHDFQAALATSSASLEQDEFGYLKEVSTNFNPFPRICFSCYHIDRFLHLVGLAEIYVKGPKK
jgi:hypothetical protein